MNRLALSAEEIQQISPQSIESVLRSLGWSHRGGVHGVSSQWILDSDSKRESVIVPLQPDFDDFIPRTWETLTRISVLYPNQADNLILQLILPGVDELENRKDEPTVRGSILWRSAEKQIIGFRQTLSAAAKSTESHQRHFGHSHKKVSEEFLSQLRMGQTRVGSFVVTAISPINALPMTKKGAVHDDPIAPTGREIVETFHTSLGTLLEASSEYIRKLNESVFDTTIESGVSLEMVKGMKLMLGTSDASETKISWSNQITRTPTTNENAVVFEAKHAPALRTAERRLTNLNARKHVSIVGNVTDLHRSAPGEPGVIEVNVISGSEVQTVMITLFDEEEYHKAIDSHRGSNLVNVTGVQERVKSRYWIVDIEKLVVSDSMGNARELSVRQTTQAPPL